MTFASTGSGLTQKDDSISLMIARFAADVEYGKPAGGGIVHQEAAAALHFVFTTLAAMQTGAVGFALAQDPMNYPGHLIAHLKGRTVYIPFHLVEVVPSGEDIEYLISQSDAVRIFHDSTICLSGSATFGLQFASDLDFCEYVSHTGRRVAQAFLSKNALAIPFCVNVRHGPSEQTYPWTTDQLLELCPTDSGWLGAKCTCVSREWKFDYVGRLPRGPVPISNLCLHESDAEAQSWSYQEVVITQKSQPIRYLVVPNELGQYVLWLREKIDEYSKSRPEKAVKRALSLCRILRLSPQSDRLLALAELPAFAAYCREKTLNDLRSAFSLLPPHIQVALGPIHTPECAEPDKDIAEFSVDRCSALLDETISRYDEIMSRARELVGGLRGKP